MVNHGPHSLPAEPVISDALCTSSPEPVKTDLRAPSAGLVVNHNARVRSAEPVVTYDLRALPVGVELQGVQGADVDHYDLEAFFSLPEILNEETAIPVASPSSTSLSPGGQIEQQQLFSETRSRTTMPVDSLPFPYASDHSSRLPHLQPKQRGHSAASAVPMSTFRCKFRGCLRSFARACEQRFVFPLIIHTITHCS